jgi:ferric-dicitrate binding protein FerR (iron transport regulator)
MKRREKINNQSIAKSLGLFGSLSREELEAAEERASRRFGNATARDSSVNAPFAAVELATEITAVRGRRWRLAMVAASAAVFLAVIIGGIVWRQAGSLAAVETADGSVYRIVNGKARVIPVGQSLDAGQTVRTNGGVSAVLKLADGSRVEMRSQSELSLERTEDGVRILLRNGGIIVNAAKQREGRHLYVQTKDVTVSVVGTVFLVNAEEGGSRVAVIEGEVRVKQGTTTKSLLPSDQLTTSPSMGLRPVGKEIVWSLQAMEHLALLAKSSSARVGSQNSSPREAFELVSIRPRASSGGGGRGFDGSAAPRRQPSADRSAAFRCDQRDSLPADHHGLRKGLCRARAAFGNRPYARWTRLDPL